jgi:hypothetical protein
MKNMVYECKVNRREKVGFEVLTAVSMKIAVFWVVADYTVLQPRRQQSSEERNYIIRFLMQDA